ncbi:hypothetical protein AA13594_2403 [Gluconacetobacter azotocaptans DSM 13594]|nr:hypothetical protein AA13594_2403 [Gluconacetobacter azotocaptans DSM 13594]
MCAPTGTICADRLLKPPAIGFHLCRGRGSPLARPPEGNRTTEDVMAWTAPKITEIPLGAEINTYVCGEKK